MTERRRKTVYVVRHGFTAWNEEDRILGHRDLGLSERGRAQAAGAGRMLGPCRLDLALTSPLSRTRETAAIVLGDRDVPLETDPRLIELRLGDWEGKTRAELRELPSWQAWVSTPDQTSTPEGERLADTQARAAAALEGGLARVPPGGGLAVFTHGGVVRVLLLHLLGLPLSSYHKLRCDCASVSAFELTPEGSPRLHRALALNLTDPLLALDDKPAG
jgi:broad specificity phosphatase PhoE